jgi:hypothetical protein
MFSLRLLTKVAGQHQKITSREKDGMVCFRFIGDLYDIAPNGAWWEKYGSLVGNIKVKRE